MEHGFHPLTRGSPADLYLDPGDVTNSRYDRGPAYYVDNPRDYRYCTVLCCTVLYCTVLYRARTPPPAYRVPIRPIPLQRPSFSSRPIQGSYPYPQHSYR